MEPHLQEISRLQEGISSLASLLALPAVWAGGKPPQVMGTLLEVLLAMLRLDFAYGRFSDGSSDTPHETLRVADREKTPPPELVGRLIGALGRAGTDQRRTRGAQSRGPR